MVTETYVHCNPSEEITAFDVEVFGITGAACTLWPKPYGHAERVAAMGRIQTAWDAIRAEEWPRLPYDLITEGRDE